MNLWGLMNTASLYASGSSAGSISIATYGAAAAKSKKDSAPCSWSRREIARVSETMPVTFDAAENDPIFSGRSAYRSSSSRSWARSMWPSRSSRIVTTSAIDSRHGQLVAVVLVRADEHDRALVRRDPRAQVPAVVEVGGDAQVEHVHQAVDRGGGPGAAEDHRVALGIAADAVEHEAPRLLAEARRLEPGAGRLGVGVRVQRQDRLADVVLDERRGSGRTPCSRRR